MMLRGRTIIKIIFLLFIAFILFGCAKTTPTQAIADSVKESLTEIKESLPKECRTETVDKKISAVSKRVDSMVDSCEVEKVGIEQEKIRWKWAFFALVLVMCAYAGRRLSSKYL